MLDAVYDLPFAYVLCGVIWALALGFAAGNYACSLVHRLPRGRLILDKTPYCGSCGTLLKVKDLFPVVSALLLRHRCRYCGRPFPVSHTWTEVLVGLLFVLNFLAYGFSERYLLVALIGVFAITLAAIEANEHVILDSILVCLTVFGMLHRVLLDGSIYDFFQGGLFGLIIGAALWRKGIRRVGHIYVLPKPALLLACGGVCVGVSRLPYFLALFVLGCLLFSVTRRLSDATSPAPMSAPFSLALMPVVMYM